MKKVIRYSTDTIRTSGKDSAIITMTISVEVSGEDKRRMFDLMEKEDSKGIIELVAE